MSIIWTLRKLVDPIAHREAQAAQERDRKHARRQGLGEGGDTPPTATAETSRRFECRVCGHRSADEEYCPRCLAATMVELSDEPEPAAGPGG